MREERREKEKREERRRCGLRCNVLSRAVLSCDVYHYIKILFECCDFLQFFATCGCFKHFKNVYKKINIFIDKYTCMYRYMCVLCAFVCVLCVIVCVCGEAWRLSLALFPSSSLSLSLSRSFFSLIFFSHLLLLWRLLAKLTFTSFGLLERVDRPLVSLRTAETEQLYQIKRMFGGFGKMFLDLFSNWKCVRFKGFFRWTSLKHVIT